MKKKQIIFLYNELAILAWQYNDLNRTQTFLENALVLSKEPEYLNDRVKLFYRLIRLFIGVNDLARVEMHFHHFSLLIDDKALLENWIK